MAYKTYSFLTNWQCSQNILIFDCFGISQAFLREIKICSHFGQLLISAEAAHKQILDCQISTTKAV
jgi:hypothetical protein